jgi:hypothetical protein
MSLDQLHALHLASLTGEGVVDYLLSCQDYLKEEDVIGWKKRFAPGPSIEINEPPPPPKKRRRMSPDACVWSPFPPCKSCKSEEVVDDMKEGCVVCTACGLVQVHQNLGMSAANMSFEQLKNGERKKVHLYSRVVYFRSFLLGLQGKTRPSMSTEELGVLRATCAGESWIDEAAVSRALKKLKLAAKFRRHRYSIACMLNPDYKPVSMEGPMFFEFLRLFRVIECHWQHGMKRKLRERRVFFSYPYVFYQLCIQLGVMHLTGVHHLLHNRVALDKLHYAYGCIAKKAAFKFDVDVHRDGVIAK